MISLNRVTKVYDNGVGVKALDAIDIEFPERGMVFVLGKSGSGKSTLLNLMAGMDAVSEGTLTVMGQRLPEELGFDDYRNNVVGFVFQEFNLNKALSVRENVLVSERLLNRKINKKKAEAALVAVGLGGKGRKKINQLSGGEQQRTAIARAIIKEPKIILADEPTGNLDENNGRIVFELLKKFSEDRLVVVVSHDRPSAYKYADRIIELSDGHIESDTERNPLFSERAVVDGDNVLLSEGAELSREDLELLSLNRDKTVVLNGEKRFVKSREVKEEHAVKGAIEKPIRRLATRNVFYLAWRNLVSRKYKTLLTIILSTITFAVLGLSVIITSYSEHTAASYTFRNNNSGEIVVFMGGKNEYGNFSSDTGAPLPESAGSYFQENYSGYAAIHRLNGFTLNGFTLPGAFELNGEAELEYFGYTLMDFSKDEDNPRDFVSRFPNSGEPVEADEGFFGIVSLTEVVITDYLAYKLYSAAMPDVVPTDAEGLMEFLESGFEADAVNMLNAMANMGRNNFDNARLRVVGVLDTGYKDKYFEYVRAESADFEKAYVNYLYDVNNYYLMLYGARGFSENCYHENLYSSLSDVDMVRDEALSERELMLTDNLFNSIYGHDFNGTPEAAAKIGGVDFTGYTVVGVIRNSLDGENTFKTAFGVRMSPSGFDYAKKVLSYQRGVRISVESSQVKGLFDYMEANSLYYASLYSRVTAAASPTINNMKTIFIPISIIIAAIAVVAIAMFLITAVTKKQKDIGVLKALGAKTPDITKIYIVEAAVTLLSVIVLSSLATYALYSLVGLVLVESLKRFINSTMIEEITVLYLTWIPFVINVAAVIVIGILSIIYPTRKISKMQPVDAMKAGL